VEVRVARITSVCAGPFTLGAAEELLEQTTQSIDWIAAEVGFDSAATLRHHFTRVRGVSQQQYRRQFAC
jgi:transcriptional regulator GlxA family with amidase domain